MDRHIVAVDFDGTCVTHEFPSVGRDIGAGPVLRRLSVIADIVLWTMRDGAYLDDAVAWFAAQGVPLWGVNQNPDQARWTASPKAFAHIYIDDMALGCPLIVDPEMSDRPFVDWDAVGLALVGMIEGF